MDAQRQWTPEEINAATDEIAEKLIRDIVDKPPAVPYLVGSQLIGFVVDSLMAGGHYDEAMELLINIIEQTRQLLAAVVETAEASEVAHGAQETAN